MIRGDAFMHLKDLSIYWEQNHTASKHYYLSRSSILVQKNGWVEGFMKEESFHSGKEEIGFVFGIYFPDRIMDLFYGCDNFISRFYCEKDVLHYNGTFSSIGPYKEFPAGQCSIMVLDRSIYSEEEIICKANISKSLIGDRGHIFYNHMVENKEQFIMLEGYQNRKLKNIVDFLGTPDGGSKYEKTLKRYQ